VFPRLRVHDLRRATFTLGKSKTSFDDLKREVRETGTARALWNVLGVGEPYFPPTFDMATSSTGLRIAAELGQFKVEFQGPMRVAPIEYELAEDILFFRRAACESSVFHDFVDTTRYFRAYVFACTSLVEAFLNRPVLLHPGVGDGAEAVEQLKKPSDFEARITLWVRTFCKDPISKLKSSSTWDHFQQLRKERNRFIHALDPHLGCEIRTLVHGLNLVRNGVGGFMGKLREMQQLPRPPFVDRLESAPEVRFRPRKGEPVPKSRK
jgi:hypothetical protein